MEENKDLETKGTETNENGNEGGSGVNYEAEYVRLMAEVKKLKATSDKNASEAADYKKKWKSTLDESQQRETDKAEADKIIQEELAQLRRERDLGKAEKSFLSLGYSSDLATRAAEAQLDGNFDSLMEIQKSFIAQIEKDAIAKATKGMGIPPIDNGGKGITKEQFDKMSLAERSELYNKDRATYEALSK